MDSNGTGIITETVRLFLREMEDDDFDALYAVLADSDIMQHYPYTFDDIRVRNWITRNRERYQQYGFGLWAVCLKDTGEMIGDCGLTLQSINGRILPEIGYHIRGDQQNQGYAKEAATAVRDWAFQNTDYPALYSYCKYTNVPSYRTAEAIGMHFAEEYPDEINGITHVSVVSRAEWNKLKGYTAIGNKVIVLGCSGSGKSTFARRLHERTGLPLVHLDNIWWKADRTHITREEFDRKLCKILQGEKWIIDGDYSRTYETRIRACNTVFFLDYNEETCMGGIKGRVGEERSDIPWVEDALDPELVELVHQYQKYNRPALISLLEKYQEKQLVTFRTRLQADEWLKNSNGSIQLKCD